MIILVMSLIMSNGIFYCCTDLLIGHTFFFFHWLDSSQASPPLANASLLSLIEREAWALGTTRFKGTNSFNDISMVTQTNYEHI